ncbi:MAG: RtcB family protein, partial [Clostridiaceae bacterium]|nr:RtcB family protein [Clostridiaceae bacterium]
PEAYKPMQELLDQIGETVEVLHHLKPVYNFKAKE